MVRVVGHLVLVFNHIRSLAGLSGWGNLLGCRSCCFGVNYKIGAAVR